MARGRRCLQMIMAMFAYLYYWNFVAAPELTVGEVRTHARTHARARAHVHVHAGGRAGVWDLGVGEPPDPSRRRRWVGACVCVHERTPVSLPTLLQVLETAVRLNDRQQLELFGKLANLLAGEGLLPNEALASLQRTLAHVNATL